MRLIFAGTPAAAVPTLAALRQSPHEVVGVFSQPDRPRGRGRELAPTPVAAFAREHDLALFQPERINSEVELLRSLAPDVAVVVAYGALIKTEALAVPRDGWINLHFSLLPSYRGAAPVQHALLHGDPITGATTFLLDEGMDTGPILGRMTEAVRPEDTTGALLDRLAEGGARLVLATLGSIDSGQAVPIAQEGDGVSYAPKISREQARVDWGRSARLVDRHVRAMTPEPGAWTLLDGEVVVIERAHLTEHSDPDLLPGVVEVRDGRPLVGCGDGALELRQVRPAGKRSMPAADWLRGRRSAVHFS
jgi:methionyl-tRNA formyltransferase